MTSGVATSVHISAHNNNKPWIHESLWDEKADGLELVTEPVHVKKKHPFNLNPPDFNPQLCHKQPSVQSEISVSFISVAAETCNVNIYRGGWFDHGRRDSKLKRNTELK